MKSNEENKQFFSGKIYADTTLTPDKFLTFPQQMSNSMTFPSFLVISETQSPRIQQTSFLGTKVSYFNTTIHARTYITVDWRQWHAAIVLLYLCT